MYRLQHLHRQSRARRGQDAVVRRQSGRWIRSAMGDASQGRRRQACGRRRGRPGRARGGARCGAARTCRHGSRERARAGWDDPLCRASPASGGVSLLPGVRRRRAGSAGSRGPLWCRGRPGYGAGAEAGCGHHGDGREAAAHGGGCRPEGFRLRTGAARRRRARQADGGGVGGRSHDHAERRRLRRVEGHRGRYHSQVAVDRRAESSDIPAASCFTGSPCTE